MFPMVTPDGIETGRCYNHMCRAAKRSRGVPVCPYIVCLLAAAGLVFLVTSSAAFAQGGPPAMPVTIAPPMAKRVTQWDEFSGRFEAVAQVEVRARVVGLHRQAAFPRRPGRQCRRPAVHHRQAAVRDRGQSAEAEVARNKAQVDIAELQVERGAALVKSRNIPDAEYDQRKANLAVAKAQLKTAEAAVRNAELNLDWTDVRAPLAGRISDRKVDAGNLIQGGQQGATLLATIVTLDPIRFVFDVSEIGLPALRVCSCPARWRRRAIRCNPVRIRLADESEWTRTGKVDFVDNTLSARSGTIRTRAVVENKNQLLTPGIFGRRPAVRRRV